MDHSFNFDGGDILSKIGASWFVSYKYYESIDKSHTNWEQVSAYNSRISTFGRSRNFHEFWLNKVLEMDDEKLNTNTIGLKGPKIKRMAKLILSKM